MFKQLRFLFVALLAMIVGNAMAENTATWEASSKDALPNISVGNDLTLVWLEGTGDQGPSYSTQSNKTVVYMRNGNKLTVAGADANVSITKIVITYVGDNIGLTPNVGSSSNSYSDNTSTWTGEANSITFSAGGKRYVKSIEVTYEGSAAPVVKVPELSITNISNMNTTVALDGESGKTIVVYYANTGKAAAENAKLTLYVGGAENKVVEIGTIAAGASDKWKNVTYDVTKIEAGEHEVYVALTADGIDAVNSAKTTVTFTKKTPEPVFTISASAVTVPYDAESYNVVATLTETNNVAAANVKVELKKGISDVLATQTVETLAANGSAQVTLSVAKALFGTGKNTYNLYVNDKFLATVDVTFEEAPVSDVKDLAIVEILGTIKLAEESNLVRVTVKNNGNVDIADAPVELVAANGKVLGSSTVSAAAGQQGWCQVSVNKEGLVAGDLVVSASVTVEGDATPEDNVMRTTLTVEAIPAAEATFTIAAENVSVAHGATSFNIVAKIKNTSEVDAANVEVKLLKGITLVETKTIEALAAGAEAAVTFTVNATEDDPFVAGRTVTYYVQAPKNQSQAEVTVTFENETVTPVIDMALTQIAGVSEINLKNENTIMVWYKNNSNVVVDKAIVEFKFKDEPVETKEITNIAVDAQGYVDFVVPTTGLVAGQKVNVEVNLGVENDANLDDNSLRKELAVVSGEAAPAAEIAINPISGWTVEAGEQTVSVGVTLFNNGDADAENVKVELYRSYGDGLCDAQIVNVPAGEENYKMLTFTFNYTFEVGKSYEFTAYTGYADANLENNMQTFTLTCAAAVADVSLAKIADIKATTEEDVKVGAVVKNNSAIDAADVKVGIYTQDESFQYQLVGILQTIETIAAGEQAAVEFNLGKLAAGSYKYYVRIVSEDANADNNVQDVNVKVTEPVAPVVSVSLTAIQGISNIDLSSDGNIISVWVENNGNVKTEAAKIAVKLNTTELEAQTVAVEAGKTAYASFTLPTEGLVAGTKATIVATVTVEGNAADAVTTLTREYDVVDSSVATEPVYAVTARPVEVELGAETFSVVAAVQNTSTIAAENVVVNLFYNEVIATQTIESLAAGATAEVTFADVQNPFAKAGAYTMYVQAPKAQAEVTVTVKEPSVEPIVDLAIAMIQGSLDLNYTSGNVSVAVLNNGNQDATDAAVKLTAGETVLGEKTVSVKVGQTAYAIFDVATEGLEAGELAVTATVTIDGDVTPADNTMTETIIVKAKDAAQPTFTVTAENVSVAYGATSFEIKATVKNTSEVTANGLTVKLMKGIEEVETKTLDIVLAAGAEETVTFTVSATEEAPFVAGTTAIYYVQAANVAQAEVKVTFAQAPVEQKVDLAVTAISGRLSVEIENNALTVFVENLGTVDAKDAAVTLTAGETVLGTATVSVKAGASGFCSIAVPATALQNASIEVTATVEAEGDVDLTNNSLTANFEIALPEPQVSITVSDVAVQPNTTSFFVPVKVKNLRENYAAKNVKVMIYDSFKLIGQTTIETIAAGAEETVNVSIELENAYTENTTLKAWATGFSETQYVEFNLTVGQTVGVMALKAAMGNNVKVYTLDGKKVTNMKKGGVYVVNGKKVVLK